MGRGESVHLRQGGFLMRRTGELDFSQSSSGQPGRGVEGAFSHSAMSVWELFLQAWSCSRWAGSRSLRSTRHMPVTSPSGHRLLSYGWEAGL